MADFLDALGQYASNRFDRATQPLTDPSAYLQDRLYNDIGMAPPGETEEERRKRLEREAAARGNTEVQTQQVKTYADGSQERTVTTQEPAPITPVVPQQQAPVPQQMPMEQPVQQPISPVAQQVQQPQAPVAPIAPPVTWSDIQGQEVNNAAPTMPALAQAQGPVNPAIATPALGTPQVFPPTINVPQPPQAPVQPQVVPQAPAERTLAQQAPGAPMEQAGPPTSLMTQAGWQDRITTAQTPQQFRQIMGDPNTPEPIAQLAAGRYASMLRNKEEERKAERDIERMTPTDLSRAMTKKSEEGSYIKAILFARLGLNDLAKEEQQKLGGGFKLESVVGPDGQRYTAEFNGQGGITQAYDASGKSVDEQTKANLNANAIASKGVGQAGATRIRDSQGKEWSVVPTTRGSVFYDTTGRPGIPQGNTVPIGIGSDVELAYQKGFYGAQGTAQGKGAGEGFKPGTTIAAPGMPGGRPTGLPSGQTAEDWARQNGIPISPQGGVRDTQGQANQVAQWYAGGMQGPRPAEPGTSRHEAGQAIDVPAAGRTPENKAKLEAAGFTNPVKGEPWHYEAPRAPATANIPNPNAPQGVPSAGGIAQQRQALETGAKRTESFNKIIDTEYRENGQKGEVVSNNRKQQFDILNQIDPSTGKGMAETISGLYTAANESPGNQKLTIVRDILTGKALPEQDASKRIAELNISPAAKSALQQYNSLNSQISAMTLKETAGPGSVSDAEQQANRARNVDITRAPMLGAYNIMGQSQFSADLQRYKSDLAANTNAPNATAFDRDFRKYQQELTKSYREMAEARLDFINKNGGATNPAAIRQGYKLFPTPEYDVSTGEWKHKKPLTKIFGQ